MKYEGLLIALTIVLVLAFDIDLDGRRKGYVGSHIQYFSLPDHLFNFALFRLCSEFEASFFCTKSKNAGRYEYLDGWHGVRPS